MDIIDHEIEGRTVTCIRLGDENLQVPKHMMTGEKKKGILYIDGKKSDWVWKGLCTIDHQRYFYFDRLELEDFDSISGVHRDRALELIRTLAMMLQGAGEDFASPLVGTIPTWRIYIVSGRGLLVLPPDLGDLISVYMSEEERFCGHGCYVKSSTEEGFALIRQMGQFLYYSLTGTKPYEKQDVRQAGFHTVPLDVYKDALFPKLDEKTAGFISFLLNAKEREQRDIMGNRKSSENLEWFVRRSEGLDWSVDSMEREGLASKARELASTPEVAHLMEDIARKAKRRNFWRVKGTIITTAAVVFILLVAFFTSYMANLLEPPSTRDLGQEEIIEAFYQAQNSLNVDALTETLKGCDAPQETEVINLYVTTMTRSAYEGTSPCIPVDQWLEAGSPAIASTQFVYGVTDLEITQTGENSWHVEGLYYTPYPYNEEDTVAEYPEDKVIAYTYTMSQDFSFTWNDRGWWNISDVSDIHVEYLGPVTIEVDDSIQSGYAAMM